MLKMLTTEQPDLWMLCYWLSTTGPDQVQQWQVFRLTGNQSFNHYIIQDRYWYTENHSTWLEPWITASNNQANDNEKHFNQYSLTSMQFWINHQPHKVCPACLRRSGTSSVYIEPDAERVDCIADKWSSICFQPCLLQDHDCHQMEALQINQDAVPHVRRDGLDGDTKAATIHEGHVRRPGRHQNHRGHTPKAQRLKKRANKI